MIERRDYTTAELLSLAARVLDGDEYTVCYADRQWLVSQLQQRAAAIGGEA
jgi:hypothetical protein